VILPGLSALALAPQIQHSRGANTARSFSDHNWISGADLHLEKIIMLAPKWADSQTNGTASVSELGSQSKSGAISSAVHWARLMLQKRLG
jgi:hypothetical protein